MLIQKTFSEKKRCVGSGTSDIKVLNKYPHSTAVVISHLQTLQTQHPARAFLDMHSTKLLQQKVCISK